MSDELQLLIKQKQQIEEKIQNLRNRCWRAGRARLIQDPSASGRKDKYCLQIQGSSFETKKTRWCGIGRSDHTKSLVEEIPSIIRDLQALYEMLQKEDA